MDNLGSLALIGQVRKCWISLAVGYSIQTYLIPHSLQIPLHLRRLTLLARGKRYWQLANRCRYSILTWMHIA